MISKELKAVLPTIALKMQELLKEESIPFSIKQNKILLDRSYDDVPFLLHQVIEEVTGKGVSIMDVKEVSKEIIILY